MEKKYICVHDYQGTDFAIGRTLTAKEWGEQAYEWADGDGWEHPEECLLENHDSEEDCIAFIRDMWELNIVEYKEIKPKWFDDYKISRIKEFRLVCDTDDWFTDLITFDHYVEWQDVVDIVQYVKSWPDYFDTDILKALEQLCPLKSKWIGDLHVLKY